MYIKLRYIYIQKKIYSVFEEKNNMLYLKKDTNMINSLIFKNDKFYKWFVKFRRYPKVTFIV